jgi:hypothetical protein
MEQNVKLSEQMAILGTINPASVAAGTVVSTWVSVANFNRLAAILQTGSLGASATVDAKLRQATDSSGTGAKDITGKSITQLVKASNDNNQVVLDCSAEDVDATNGYGYVALSVTVGTAASLLSALMIGGNARFEPASAFNPTTVVQVV